MSMDKVLSVKVTSGLYDGIFERADDLGIKPGDLIRLYLVKGLANNYSGIAKDAFKTKADLLYAEAMEALR